MRIRIQMQPYFGELGVRLEVRRFALRRLLKERLVSLAKTSMIRRRKVSGVQLLKTLTRSIASQLSTSMEEVQKL